MAQNFRKRKRKKANWIAFVSRYETIPILEYLLCRVCPLVSRPGPHILCHFNRNSPLRFDSILVIRRQAPTNDRALKKQSTDATRMFFQAGFRRDTESVCRSILVIPSRKKNTQRAKRVRFPCRKVRSSNLEFEFPSPAVSPCFPPRSPAHTIFRHEIVQKTFGNRKLKAIWENVTVNYGSRSIHEFPRLKPTSFLVKTITPRWDRSADNARYNDGSGGGAPSGSLRLHAYRFDSRRYPNRSHSFSLFLLRGSRWKLRATESRNI